MNLLLIWGPIYPQKIILPFSFTIDQILLLLLLLLLTHAISFQCLGKIFLLDIYINDDY